MRFFNFRSSSPAMPKELKDIESQGPTRTPSHESLPSLERVETQPQLPPPDVGLQAWLQVLVGFFLMLNSWGIIVSYGSFQTYYTTGGGITDETSPSSIAWIGSIQVFLLLFIGALGGKYFDAGYVKSMIWVGNFLVVFGLMMTSLAEKYWQFILAQGVTVGIGMGLLSAPSLGLPSTWFYKHRGLAVGLVTLGSGIGGIFFPIMIHNLIPQVGFAWTTRILGLISLVTLTISAIIAHPRLPPRQRGSIVEYQALADPEFALYTAGMFFGFLGFFTFYTFVEDWAIATHVDLKGLEVYYLLTIVNTGGVFGRVVPNAIGDIMGPLNVQSPSVIISAILVLVWIPTHTVAPLIIICILYGFFSGAVMSMPAPAISSMTKDMTTIGGRIGVVFIGVSISSLIGAPVTGAIVQAQNGSFVGAQIFSGVVMVAGGLLMFGGRMVHTHWKIVVRA